MADAPAPKKGMGFFKTVLGGGVGLATGVVGVYATAIVDKVAKPQPDWRPCCISIYSSDWWRSLFAFSLAHFYSTFNIH